MTLKTRCQSIGSAFGEAMTCLALALRSSLRPGILFRSSLLCLLAFGLWTWLFYNHFALISMVSGYLSLFIVGGGAVLGFIPTGGGLGVGAGASVGAGAGFTGMASVAGVLGMLVIYAALLTLAVIALLYLCLIVLSIRLALRWVLMDSLRERALRQYPHLAQRTCGSSELLRGARYFVAPWLGLGIGPLLCLLVPVINGALLIVLLAYLNVRFLTAPALSGIASGSEQLQAVQQQRGPMIFFGLLIFLIALVPVLNLLVPALLGAGSCHLAYRGMERAQSPAGAACAPQVSLPPL
ncbi:EI24 domain-containing protein [Pseudomonas purpurea]|uniref:EI24 domain-containing protein n=1 Tax=Pseudomonas purpurea TaxID=3136737 RepID=UPI003267E378